jgi:NhaP-type Na+/H+ or K+/H+ antiporter
VAPGVASKVIAACCGLSAFAVAVLAGLAADNPTEVILGRALVSMIGMQLVGLLIGSIAERTVSEAIERYRAERPVADAAAGATPGTPVQGKDDGVLSV